MRIFDSGATRDNDETKPDYEGFYHPLVIKRFGRYMAAHRKQADGNLRASDNWQKGIPREAYIKSLLRHVQDLWLHHDLYPHEAGDPDIESVLCAILFNAQGYLFEILRSGVAGSAWQNCPACFGTGLSAGTTCPYCHGDKKIPIHDIPPEKNETSGPTCRGCSRCNGDGQEPYNGTGQPKLCCLCDGGGVLTTETQE